MIYKSENAPKESEKGCYHAVSGRPVPAWSRSTMMWWGISVP